MAAEIRKELAGHELRREATSKRAAIEGTISAIKRGRGTGKLSVRGQVKSNYYLSSSEKKWWFM